MQTTNIYQFVGQTLGNYQIEHLLGQSQWGAIYQARHYSRPQREMLTLLRLPEGFTDQQWQMYVTREAAKLVGLTHPHVLAVSDFGIQPGYIYLVTDFVKDPSLGQALRESGYLTALQVVPVLKQIAAGLDYIHSQGIAHGMLSPLHIIVNQSQAIRITGLGLCMMLAVQRNPRPVNPWDHLVSASGAFLGNPGYIAPEQVQGRPIDARADIYALGVILFELLSGTLPFNGTNPLDVAALRLQQPLPSLHARQPQVPEALELVIRKALEVDPDRRYQRAGDVSFDFEHALALLDTAKRASIVRPNGQDRALTLPPTTHWFDMSESRSYQAVPAQASANFEARSLAGIDPFDWWSSRSSGASKPSGQAGTFSAPKASGAPGRSGSIDRRRRKLVVSVVAGGAAAGVLTVTGISFVHLLQSMKQTPSQALSANMSANGSSMQTHSGQTPAAGSKTTPAAQAAGNKTVPTAQPTAKATAAGHTGTVIGSTMLAKNSSLTFTNPKDGVSSLLLHLSNGQFVACERTCTHQGVPVNYDPGTGMLVCPAHGAVFNPQNGFSHVSGPGQGPLTVVRIQENGDGTVTTG